MMLVAVPPRRGLEGIEDYERVMRRDAAVERPTRLELTAVESEPPIHQTGDHIFVLDVKLGLLRQHQWAEVCPAVDEVLLDGLRTLLGNMAGLRLRFLPLARLRGEA